MTDLGKTHIKEDGSKISNLEEADIVVDVGGVVVLVADDLGDVDSLLDAFTDIKLR